MCCRGFVVVVVVVVVAMEVLVGWLVGEGKNIFNFIVSHLHLHIILFYFFLYFYMLRCVIIIA